ncbi:PREDICTED: UDP-glucuronate:xylan alpha-glucuronosyltransferase 2 isoform X2 [Tarenaya hassleriana]|uniref:UDP-glucuronate:xylan alpha-glucuronosyltransferase 2 isoform X2 n=1 Tax=Tarenaya hassleriana TaxID=28532 RepID=UPI00053C2317|nr:PREDICTED: UDP-glucuronate:xylan alpha-glucuronosyltransferase 2 isoform X2 [Tarenaya hassleriana]
MPSQGKVERGVKMQELMEDSQINSGDLQTSNKTTDLTKVEVPSFMKGILKKVFGRPRIGMVNMDDANTSEWKHYGETIPIRFDRVSDLFKWQDLFPEWIDEEEETDVPTCPEIPMPDITSLDKMDVIVAKLPCNYPEEGWRREVGRLQMHLAAANLAAKKAKRDWRWRTTVVFWSKCRPMIEIFRCDDLVRREGDWWWYRPEVVRLQQKLDLPVGSCNLALPLWGRQGTDEVYDVSKMEAMTKTPRREAYATVLHSSEAYVCGAITLAQSLFQTKTKRDLVLLHDNSISRSKLDALAAAGWQLRLISRIRNPRAEKDSYNEYNYSKFRLWQLTEYDKVVFIDADIIVLRSLDILFYFPQMSATGNDVWIFNSGVMVIEPSNCTFRTLMSQRNDIVSYNGGDQGYLNEIFVWWHRLPRRVNFLKNFWSNTTLETNLKNHLFSLDPPKLYSIHYLGWKPWLCYRDYDCNFDVEEQLVYASDAAHERWWRVHDSMGEGLQRFCRLTKRRRTELNWERRKARLRGSSDRHWRINVTDPRRRKSYLID